MRADPTPYTRIAKLAADLVGWYGLEPETVLTWQVFGDRGAGADGAPVVVNDAKGKAVAQTFAATAADVAELAARHCREADRPNVYLTFGVHEPAGKRQQATCRRVLAVALDCDACDWLAANRPAEFADNAEAKAYLHALPGAELAALLAEHQAAAVAALAAAGLPKPSSWWRSGYGHYALYALRGNDDGATDVDLCRAINRDLVAALNGAAGYALADKAATDAGTRVLRAPGAFNVKRPDRPLECTVLDGKGPQYTAAALRAAVPAPEPRQTAPEPRGDSPRPVDPEGRMSDRETALAALELLSPDMGYSDWLNVGMALHSVAPDLLGEWDAWSAQSAGKYEAGLCESKWQGFRADISGGVTVKTLVSMAQAVDPGFQKPGWRAKQRRESPTPRRREAAAPGQNAPPAAQEAPGTGAQLEVEGKDLAAASARLAAFVHEVKEAPEAERPGLLTDALADAELLATVAAFAPRAPEVASFAQLLKAQMPRGYRGHVDSLTDAARVVAADEGQEPPPEAKQSTKILRLAEEAEVEPFRHAGDGTLWLAVPEGNHYRALPLGEHGGGVSLWLTRLYAEAHNGSAPSATAVAEAGRRLAADADRPGAPEHDVHLRIAERLGRVYVDLGWPDWRVAEVDADGWRVVPCPRGLYFRRTSSLRPLPMPTPDGTFEPLRELLGARVDKDNFVLLVAWLLGTLQPDQPFAALALYGEQGTGKSTVCKLLRSLVDPCGDKGRGVSRQPRDEESLAAVAMSRHVLAFDNLSHVPEWLSDALSSLATGAGWGGRKRYTDHDVSEVEAKRPVIFNGITEVATRSDLLDRCLVVTLQPIAEDDRREEKDLWRDVSSIAPDTLGALLTAVSAALRHRSDVKGPWPRMADFAAWVTAAEHGDALPWEQGRFREVYGEARKASVEVALEASPLPRLLCRLADRTDEWEGNPQALFDVLSNLAEPEDRQHPKWPKDAARMGGDVRRLAPSLRNAGKVEVSDRKSNGRRLIRVAKAGSVATVDTDPVLTLIDPTDPVPTLPKPSIQAGLAESGSVGSVTRPTSLLLGSRKDKGSGGGGYSRIGVSVEVGQNTDPTDPTDPADPFASEEPPRPVAPAPVVDPDDEGGEW